MKRNTFKKIENCLARFLDCHYGSTKLVNAQLVHLGAAGWGMRICDGIEEIEAIGSLWDLETWARKNCRQGILPTRSRLGEDEVRQFEEEIKKIEMLCPAEVEIYFDVCGRKQGWGLLFDGEIFYDENADDYLFPFGWLGAKLMKCVRSENELRKNMNGARTQEESQAVGNDRLFLLPARIAGEIRAMHAYGVMKRSGSSTHQADCR